MERKAMLSEVDVKQVSLPELVKFIEEMREEFPVAVKVLAKKLFAQEYGVSPKEIEAFDTQFINSKEIIDSIHSLEGEMQHKMVGTMVLSLHDTFGFGKVRILRLWGKAQETIGSGNLSAEGLANWCEARGIDYDKTFGVQSNYCWDFKENE